MTRRFYPAVLERGPKRTFGVWFPDFPDCVAGGTSQEETLERAQTELARAIYTLAEQDTPLPDPTPMEKIEIPKGCDFIAFIAIGVEPPDVSERVNVYLPRQLIERADKRAAGLGMNRSSFFGLAVSSTLARFDLKANPGLDSAIAIARLFPGKKGLRPAKAATGKRSTKS
jgi:predicted RNase H-like HicB family nuclease